MADLDKMPKRLNADGARILPYGVANGWLTRWFEAHMAVVSGAPMAPEPPRCLGCDGPTHSVSLGREHRGWFTVWPCRCGFEIEPMLGPDSPTPYIAPTVFLSLAEPEPEVPGISKKTAAAVMRAARDAGVKPGGFE